MKSSTCSLHVKTILLPLQPSFMLRENMITHNKVKMWPVALQQDCRSVSARLLTTNLRMTLRLAPFSSCTVFNNYTLLGYIIYAYINLCSPWGLSSPVVPSILPWWVEHSCLGVSRRRWKRGFNDHWMPAPSTSGGRRVTASHDSTQHSF